MSCRWIHISRLVQFYSQGMEKVEIMLEEELGVTLVWGLLFYSLIIFEKFWKCLIKIATFLPWTLIFVFELRIFFHGTTMLSVCLILRSLLSDRFWGLCWSTYEAWKLRDVSWVAEVVSSWHIESWDGGGGDHLKIPSRLLFPMLALFGQ